MKFEDLGLAPQLLRAVAAEGYEHPTPIQAQAIPHVAEGRDLLGCAQTGTGKTAAFALPILHRLMQQPAQSRRRVRVLVLSPTRELAVQIADSFGTYGRHTGLRHTTVYGGVGQGAQVRALRHGVDILIATPGRLCDLMSQGYVDLNAVEIFVLDEADRMFDMGFLPDLRRIIGRLPRERQTLLFSATMPPAIEQLATATLRNPVQVRIAPVKQTTELIEQSVYRVAQKQKTTLLIELLAGEDVSRAIVFTRTKHGADKVVRDLDRAGVTAEAIHGNKSQAARQRALAGFRANRLNVLVATDLAARGIDVDGVSHVFNFDLPHEPETYVHRIGRTGRAGASGIAIAFCSGDERKHLRAIEGLLRKRLDLITDLPAGIESEAREERVEGQRPARHDGAKPRYEAAGPRAHGKPYSGAQKPFGGAKKGPRRRRKAALPAGFNPKVAASRLRDRKRQERTATN